MCVVSRAMEDMPIVVQVGAVGKWQLPTLAMEKNRESYGHIDLHAHCYAVVCIIHGEPKSNEER